MSRSAPQDTSGVRGSIIETGQRIMAGRGFSAVGLNEILAEAGVPKGSFYHYFGSKDAFGEAMLAAYFEDYLADLDEILRRPGLTMAQRLMAYLQHWQETQSFYDCQGKCLAVKLGAEVADLSEAMRAALKHGTSGITRRLKQAIETGVAEGSLSIDGEPAGRGAEPLSALAWRQRDGEDRPQHPAFRVGHDDDPADPSTCSPKADGGGCTSIPRCLRAQKVGDRSTLLNPTLVTG